MENNEVKKLDSDNDKRRGSSLYDISSLEKIIKEERNRIAHYRPPLFGRGVSIQQSVETEKGRLLNLGLKQDIYLKKVTLIILFLFLGLETITIFIFSFLQATKLFDFRLEEWSFKLLIAATISQITYMLQVAVKHLFPINKK